MRDIGYINACIAGDHRYSSRVVVKLDSTGYVEIERWENGAVGGMDGPGGSYGYALIKDVTIAKAPGESISSFASRVVKATKRLFDNVIITYGKPSKKFEWTLADGSTLNGLSAAKVRTTLSSYGF